MNNRQLLIHDEKVTAFNELYHAYWELLFRLAYKKTGSQDDAYDLVHDLFTDIWKNLHALPPEDSLRSYLVSAIYHKVFNYFRSKGLQEKHYRNFEVFLMQQAFNDDLYTTNEDKEKWETIDRTMTTAITAMPGKMKDIFIRNVYEKQSIDQIADDLLLSKQTVKNQLQLASKRLRVAFKQVYAQLFGILPLL
jgi:RNA polymerase sigma-70 factor (ECF subfamily)